MKTINITIHGNGSTVDTIESASINLKFNTSRIKEFTQQSLQKIRVTVRTSDGGFNHSAVVPINM